MKSRTSLAPCALLIAASLLAVRPGLPAEDRTFRPIYDFVVETEGKVDSGWRILAPAQKSRILLLAPGEGPAYMVSVAEKAARPVDRTLTMGNADGSIEVLAGAVSQAKVLSLALEGAVVTLRSEAGALAIKPRPPLIGPHSVEDLIADRPNFGEGIRAYQPEPEALAYLKSYERATEIEIYFGSWCSVCEAWVPRLLKSLQDAGNPKIVYRLFGVSREFSTDEQVAKQKGVRGLPTFIIRQDGIEIGRIVGSPEKGTIEAALASLLRSRA